MDKLINYLKKDRVNKLLIVLFIIFAFILSPIVFILSENYTAIIFSPDTSLFYTPESFYETLYLTGLSGRQYYMITTWTFDLLYPMVYGLAILSYMIKKMNKGHKIILLLPIIALAADYLENTLATILTIFYKNEIYFLVYVLQFFSFIKWLFILISIIVILSLIFKSHRKNIISQDK